MTDATRTRAVTIIPANEATWFDTPYVSVHARGGKSGVHEDYGLTGVPEGLFAPSPGTGRGMMQAVRRCAMDVRGHRLSLSSLLVCGLVVVGRS